MSDGEPALAGCPPRAACQQVAVQEICHPFSCRVTVTRQALSHQKAAGSAISTHLELLLSCCSEIHAPSPLPRFTLLCQACPVAGHRSSHLQSQLL